MSASEGRVVIVQGDQEDLPICRGASAEGVGQPLHRGTGRRLTQKMWWQRLSSIVASSIGASADRELGVPGEPDVQDTVSLASRPGFGPERSRS